MLKQRDWRLLVHVRLCVMLVFFSMAASAGTFTVIYTFQGGQDGSNPVGVAATPNRVLYGATMWGGGQCRPYMGCGTVFSLTPPTAPGSAWTESVYAFSYYAGFNPTGITVGRGGAVLYGVTSSGNRCGGYVFELSPPSSTSSWKESVLASQCTGLANPWATPVVGPKGILYVASIENYGSIFSLTPPSPEGGPWTVSAIQTFNGRDGDEPNAVAVGESGALYGTTVKGGTASPLLGTVYSLTPPAAPGREWIENILHSFTGMDGDGANPLTGVLIGSGGVLYGTTVGGGATNCDPSNCGTVYSLVPPGPSGGGSYQVIYNFNGLSNGDGSAPLGGLIGLNGILYGTTAQGGTGNSVKCSGGCGTIFSLTPPSSPGGAWTESVLYKFTGNADGSYPVGTLAVDSNGVLYGVAQHSGEGGYGTVFSFKP